VTQQHQDPIQSDQSPYAHSQCTVQSPSDKIWDKPLSQGAKPTLHNMQGIRKQEGFQEKLAMIPFF
jgi:hypothetical protein